jgi:hypothetical protein
MHSAAREALPAQLAPKLVGKTEVAEIQRIIRDVIREIDAKTSDEIERRHWEVVRDGDGGGAVQ